VLCRARARVCVCVCVQYHTFAVRLACRATWPKRCSRECAVTGALPEPEALPSTRSWIAVCACVSVCVCACECALVMVWYDRIYTRWWRWYGGCGCLRAHVCARNMFGAVGGGGDDDDADDGNDARAPRDDDGDNDDTDDGTDALATAHKSPTCLTAFVVLVRVMMACGRRSLMRACVCAQPRVEPARELLVDVMRVRQEIVRVERDLTTHHALQVGVCVTGRCVVTIALDADVDGVAATMAARHTAITRRAGT
jgi:hypothetical protein